MQSDSANSYILTHTLSLCVYMWVWVGVFLTFRTDGPMEDPGWEFGTVKGMPSGSGGDSGGDGGGGSAGKTDDKSRVLNQVIIPALNKIKAQMQKVCHECKAPRSVFLSVFRKYNVRREEFSNISLFLECLISFSFEQFWGIFADNPVSNIG